MDIIVGGISSVKNDQSPENAKPSVGKSIIRRDRRKNKQDRRKSVRDGVFVSLSAKNDRRVLKERRKAP